MARAIDHGIFRLDIDEKKVGDPVELSDSEVVPTELISLGRRRLARGKHTLRVAAIGCNDKAEALPVGKLLFALDAMTAGQLGRARR